MNQVVLSKEHAQVTAEIIHRVIEKGLKPEELVPFAAVYQELITQLQKLQQQQKAQAQQMQQQQQDEKSN